MQGASSPCQARVPENLQSGPTPSVWLLHLMASVFCSGTAFWQTLSIYSLWNLAMVFLFSTNLNTARRGQLDASVQGVYDKVQCWTVAELNSAQGPDARISTAALVDPCGPHHPREQPQQGHELQGQALMATWTVSIFVSVRSSQSY